MPLEVKILTIKPSGPAPVIEYGIWNGTTWVRHGEQVTGDISGLTTLAEAQAAAIADATAKGFVPAEQPAAEAQAAAIADATAKGFVPAEQPAAE